MINRFWGWLKQKERGEGAADGPPIGSDLQIAAAALLITAALMDGDVRPAEKETIRSILATRFDLSADEAETLIEKAERVAEDSTQLYGLARAIRENVAVEDRSEILEMLWETAYADGVVHHYESNLVRRIAGLLYVPDAESGRVRQRVAARLGID